MLFPAPSAGEMRKEKNGTVYRQKTGGFGMMRLPLLDSSDAASIDIAQTKRMVDAFLENGFTYFDTAWMYCGFKSEDAVKEVLTSRHPRESFTLTTKLHAGFLSEKEDRDRIFDTQRKKTGVSFFDYYLLHDIGADHYKVFTELDCFRWLMAKKDHGLVRHIGFSFHDSPELLDRILTEHPEMEFVQLQLNYLDWENPVIQSRRCYEVAEKHGIPVIVMEPVKGGTLAKVPQEVENAFRSLHPELSPASWAIRFAASQPNVKLVLSGMSDLMQLEDNMSYMKKFQPLNAEETALVHQAAKIINSGIAIPCTGCSYCTEGCPQNIAIPKYFSLYNANVQEGLDKGWTAQMNYYDRLIQQFGKAGDCIGCGQCEGICPQHLPIIDNLKKVAAHFEK